MPQINNPSSSEKAKSPRLVATLGPSSEGKEAELTEFGATHFRINASHLSVAGLCEYIKGARTRAPRVPIIVDLQGAKMRLGDFEPRGYAGVVLSDETAIGCDPVNAVRIVRELIDASSAGSLHEVVLD